MLVRMYAGIRKYIVGKKKILTISRHSRMGTMKLVKCCNHLYICREDNFQLIYFIKSTKTNVKMFDPGVQHN